MKKTTIGVAALGVALALSACGDKQRSAKAETSVAEAKVTTTMPKEAVSDAQLEASANRAVANASQPQAAAVTPGGAEPAATTVR